MNEIIPISEENGKKAVSARKLYETLGLVQGKFARFAKKYIINNEFAFEFDDWVGVDIDVEGNKTMDYALSLPFAKKICMLSKTKKGEEVRNYFLELEEYSKNPKELSRKELLLLALKTEEELEKANETIKLLSFVNKTYTSTEIAHEIGFTSAVKLNKYLNEKKIQYKVNGTWCLYSNYADQGYEILKQEVLDNGIVKYNRHWTQRGREWLLNMFK